MTRRLLGFFALATTLAGCTVESLSGPPAGESPIGGGGSTAGASGGSGAGTTGGSAGAAGTTAHAGASPTGGGGSSAGASGSGGAGTTGGTTSGTGGTAGTGATAGTGGSAATGGDAGSGGASGGSGGVGGQGGAAPGGAAGAQGGSGGAQGGAAGCGPGQKPCAGACVDASPANGCDDPSCTPCGAHASASCTMGACVLDACTPPWADCDQNAKNGCEVDTSVTPAHCGACAAACSTSHVTVACSASTCDGACATGYDDCNGDKQLDGCEAELATEVAHCGGCNLGCSNQHLTTPTCTGGVCGGTCDTGYADCDGNKQTNGCEIDLTSDPQNCGGCGVVCDPNAGSICAGGYCAGVWPTWPMPNVASDVAQGAPHPQTYVDHGDGTVSDQVTTLMWQKKGGTAPDWNGASAACASLALGGPAPGYDDWRLPTLIELISITDITASSGVAPMFFPNQLAGRSFSALRVPAGEWQATYAEGYVNLGNPNGTGSYRCVRSTQPSMGTGHYVVGTGGLVGTVADVHTGLTWQADSSPAAVTQSDAVAYCASLPLAGGGFRLPTLRELMTLFDGTQPFLFIDPNAFPSTQGPTVSMAEGYWSVSGWYAMYGECCGDGQTGPQGASTLSWVRCVR